MKAESRQLLTLAGIAVAIASTFPQPASAIQIDGLSPLAPLAAASGKPMVHGRQLEIALPQQTITVDDWPRFLPQRFSGQKISGMRQLRPAGPQDRLEFIRPAEERPWLLLGDGAGRATELVTGWQLELDDGRWLVSNGEQRKILQEGRMPTLVRSGEDVWCIYLLESSLPVSQTGIAQEAEPHAAWAAVRLKPGRQACAAGTTAK